MCVFWNLQNQLYNEKPDSPVSDDKTRGQSCISPPLMPWYFPLPHGNSIFLASYSFSLLAKAVLTSQRSIVIDMDVYPDGGSSVASEKQWAILFSLGQNPNVLLSPFMAQQHYLDPKSTWSTSLPCLDLLIYSFLFYSSAIGSHKSWILSVAE